MLNIDSVKLLYLLKNKVKGFIKEITGNNYVTLFPTDESKGTLKPYEVLRNNVRGLVKVIINNTDNYDEKHMKVKCNSDDDFSLKKTRKLYNMLIVG